MSHLNQETLSHLLLELMDDGQTDYSLEMLDAALNSFTQGANDFVATTGKKMQPSELKDNLRLYPLAQILIGIIRFQELNQDTRVIRDTVLSLLDTLDNSESQETLH